MTYSELKTAVAGYFNRGDLDTKVGEWIKRAESFLFREISPGSIEATASGTASGTIALPVDFSMLRRLDVDYYGTTVTLDYTTQGRGFVVEGNEIRLVNMPQGSFSYTLYYSPKITALSDANTTNWLLTNGYDLYFYVSALEGAKAMKNSGEVNTIMPLIPTLLESVKGYAARSKIPTMGSLRVRPRSSV